jgi:excisionase family DNA binding protein
VSLVPADLAGKALLDAQTLARLLSCSLRHVRRMDAAAELPAPLHVGSRLVRWRREEIERWIGEGCPDRRTWEAMERARRRK